MHNYNQRYYANQKQICKHQTCHFFNVVLVGFLYCNDKLFVSSFSSYTPTLTENLYFLTQMCVYHRSTYAATFTDDPETIPCFFDNTHKFMIVINIPHSVLFNRQKENTFYLFLYAKGRTLLR